MSTGSKKLSALLKIELAKRERWHARFFRLSKHVAEWSKDPSMQVGAVIVDDHRRVVSVGYNGFPRGVKDLSERYEDRSVKYPMVVHAETNAIITAATDLTGHTLYCSTGVPCPDCMGVIIQAGITTVVAPDKYEVVQTEGAGKRDWDKAAKISETMAEEAEVELIWIED